MNILTKDPHSEQDILDIPVLKALGREKWEYEKHKDDHSVKQRLYDAHISFFDWYISYCELILKGKTYSQSTICEIVFTPDIANDIDLKCYIRCSLFISKAYVELLKKKLSVDKLDVYKSTLSALEADLEYLIVLCEVHLRRNIDKLGPNSWRRRILDPKEIFWAANAVFNIEDIGKIEDLHLRDVKPVAMFQMRQCLEVFGRNIIGYWQINDSNQKSIKQFTQVAWEFLRLESNKPYSLIEFPFVLNNIILVNNWSHSFVHTTYLYPSYVQQYALEVINELFKSSPVEIETINGTYRSLEYASIKITQYNELRRRFVEYLHQRKEDAVVEWKDVNQVGAYILSL